MNTKSQITLFILFGAILFIGIVFEYYLKNDVEKSVEVPLDISPIEAYIQNCVQSIGKNALILIGKQSGYYQLKSPYLKDTNFNLSYYLFNNIDFSPTLKDLEREISKYIDNNLQTCINNFGEFKKQGLEISNYDMHPNTKIGLNSISISIDSPVTISRGKTIQKIDYSNVVMGKINLYSIYNVSKEITSLQHKEPNRLCLSCLYELGEKNGLYVDVTEYMNNTLIFDIRDYNSSITGIYNFTFAVKYPEISCQNLAGYDDIIFLNDCLEAEKERLSNKIDIGAIPDFDIKFGKAFFYDVNSTGKNIFFEDFTSLFQIDKLSGIINFTPTNEQIGSHQIWIRAYDWAGNKDYANFKINITK